MWVCSTGFSIAALSFLGLDAHVLEDGLDRSLGFFVGVSGQNRHRVRQVDQGRCGSRPSR